MSNVIRAEARFKESPTKEKANITEEKAKTIRGVDNILPSNISAQVEAGSNMISWYIQKYFEQIFGVRIGEVSNLDQVYMDFIIITYWQIQPTYSWKNILKLLEAMLATVKCIQDTQRTEWDSWVHRLISENDYAILKHYIILECILIYRENPHNLPDWLRV